MYYTASFLRLQEQNERPGAIYAGEFLSFYCPASKVATASMGIWNNSGHFAQTTLGVIQKKTAKFGKIMLDFSVSLRIIRNVPKIEDLCNGSTPDSDSVCGGSNPSSSAMKTDHFGGRFFILCAKIQAGIHRDPSPFLIVTACG